MSHSAKHVNCNHELQCLTPTHFTCTNSCGCDVLVKCFKCGHSGFTCDFSIPSSKRRRYNKKQNYVH